MTEELTRRGFKAWGWQSDKTGAIRFELCEKYLIGTFLIHFDRNRIAFEEFNPDVLFFSELKLIYGAMRKLAEDDIAVDLLTVAERLTTDGQLAELPGGVNYLLELADQSEDKGDHHVSEWIRIIESKSHLRTLKNDLSGLLIAVDDERDLEVIRDRLATICEAVPENKSKAYTTIENATRELVALRQSGGLPTVFWGIPEVDAAIGGVAPGEMVVIGGLPSHGKSLMALQWLDSAAEHGIAGLFVSLEMGIPELAARQLSHIAPIDLGIINDHQRMDFEIRQHFEGRAPLYISSGSPLIESIERRVRTAVNKLGVKIVAIDYVQLLRSSDGKKSEYQRITEASIACKDIARQNHVVVLLLSQLNRSVTSRENGHPRLSDLRGSGQIEQDGDVILFPYHPVRVDPKNHPETLYQIYHAKNRNRGIGTALIEMEIDLNRQRLKGKYIPFQEEGEADRW